MDSGHYDLIGVFAKSQQDFPIGVGVNNSLRIKNRVLGTKKLEFCTKRELLLLITELRDYYLQMKKINDDNIS